MKFPGKTFRSVRVNATDRQTTAVNLTSAGYAIIKDRTDVMDRRHRRRYKSKVCAFYFFNENINNLHSRYTTWIDSMV